MNIFELINDDDVVALSCLIGMLYIVGTNMASPKVRQWGWRMAAAGYVVFVIFAIFRLHPFSAAGLASIAFRGFFAAGLTVTVAWIGIAIVKFFFDAIVHVDEKFVVSPRLNQPEATDWEAVNKLQQQKEREKDENRKANAAEQAKVVQRCESLRLECELLYRRHALALSKHLPESQFERILSTYLAQATDIAEAERRSELIQQTILDCVSLTSTQPHYKTLEEVAAAFESRRQEVATLPYDEEVKTSLMAAINQQEESAIQRMLES